ncbi:uncharacterized protein LOC126265343 [Aethina tumida]|uniref:uncharacterized protein LOC126265343 n=1 Tax=Aethina tumida TaxID=116153 RepID=UPI002147AD3A|nr:uncharacterized protein LOC126265343 [Aethina tumida]
MNSKRQRTCQKNGNVQNLHKNITDMPDELLLMLFSYFTPQELYCIARPVCERWSKISYTTTLWEKISVGADVPTNVLQEWIQNASNLKVLHMKNRKDVNCILDEISKSCLDIEQLVVLNCWGSETSNVIKSAELCKVIQKCKKLWSFDFHDVLIRSVKFYKLLSEIKAQRQIFYCGPTNLQQRKYFA